MATGAANITEEDIRNSASMSGPELRRQHPELYGFLGALLGGVAPDQFEGSIMDPSTAKVRKGAEYGLPLSVVAALAPIAGGIAGAKGVAAGGKLAQKGMLRLGGRQDLIASHGSKAKNLLDDDAKLIPELTHMSSAIEKDQIAHPWGNVKLILRPDKLDPRTSSSSIFVRDAMTPPYMSAELTALREGTTQPTLNQLAATQPTLNQLAAARLRDRYTRPFDSKLPENTLGFDAGLSTREFNSFRGFENSSQGAGLLGKPLAINQAEISQFMQALAAMNHPNGLQGALAQVMQMPGRTFAGLDKFKLAQQVQSMPANYAELKAFGQVPLNSDTFAGAILGRPASGVVGRAQMYDVAQALSARGIPVRESMFDPVGDFQTAVQMQKATR